MIASSLMPVVDYTESPLAIRIRKAVRYARLYGLARTLSKVEGQYHMKGRRSPRRRGRNARAHVGIIGCGNFAFTTIAYHLERHAGQVIRGTMDIVPERAESLARRYGGHYATTDAERLLADPDIDLIYVASNHASHAAYAIRALDQGKSVHIEKPHVIDNEQLDRLCEAMERSRGKVRLGFNRPFSPFGQELMALVAQQTGPVTASWFVVGYRLPLDHWYNDPREGGRVLGNICHWTDFAYRLVPPERRYPIDVHPVRAADDHMFCLAFADGSTVSITFAASGDVFEGVREHLGLQRGDLVVDLVDFQRMRVDVRDSTHQRSLRWRNHGHEASVMRSYKMSDRARRRQPSDSASYVRGTAELFLRVQESLISGRRITVGRHDR
jgi:predicted dehydrogenase